MSYCPDKDFGELADLVAAQLDNKKQEQLETRRRILAVVALAFLFALVFLIRTRT